MLAIHSIAYLCPGYDICPYPVHHAGTDGMARHCYPLLQILNILRLSFINTGLYVAPQEKNLMGLDLENVVAREQDHRALSTSEETWYPAMTELPIHNVVEPHHAGTTNSQLHSVGHVHQCCQTLRFAAW